MKFECIRFHKVNVFSERCCFFLGFELCFVQNVSPFCVSRPLFDWSLFPPQRYQQRTDIPCPHFIFYKVQIWCFLCVSPSFESTFPLSLSSFFQPLFKELFRSLLNKNPNQLFLFLDCVAVERCLCKIQNQHLK